MTNKNMMECSVDDLDLTDEHINILAEMGMFFIMENKMLLANYALVFILENYIKETKNGTENKSNGG